MKDLTEEARRLMIDEINKNPLDRKGFEEKGIKVWDTSELSKEFEVLGFMFMAPFCVVRNKKTGKKGSVIFQHLPRLYFGFKEV